MDSLTHFLYYCASNPVAKMVYHASDMVLGVHSDASYLSISKSHSRSGGFFYLGKGYEDKEGMNVSLNGPIYCEASVIKHVMASAAEAEVASLFINEQQSGAFRNALKEMGHPQPETPMRTDNSTAYGITNTNLKQKCLKPIDIHFYWLQDRVDQKKFVIFWEPKEVNLGDYFTKHHPPAHHKLMRYPITNSAACLQTARVC